MREGRKFRHLRPLQTRRDAGLLTRAALLAMAVSGAQMMPGMVGPGGGMALAIDGTWGRTATGGNWSLTTNWVNNTVASGSGFTADFSFLNLTADNTVNLDSARTIGRLAFGDTTPSHNWTLGNNGIAANTLTLNQSTFVPEIDVVNQTTTIGVRLLGTVGINKQGAGTLVLTNASNSYTGGTFTTGGTLAVGNSGAVLPPTEMSPSATAGRSITATARASTTTRPSARSRLITAPTA